MKYFVIFFFSTYCLFGQTIKGKVIDAETKTPLENVSVYFKNLKKGTTTNRKGFYNLKIDSDFYSLDTLTVSIIGYYPQNLVLSELKKNDFTINLYKKTEQLKEITLLTNRKLKKEIRFRKLSSLRRGVHSFDSKLIDDKIYLIGGDGSYLEDTGKKALLEVQNLPKSNFSDLLKRLVLNPTWENYKDDLLVYNITNDDWIKSDLKFRERAYHNTNLINNKLYVIGGKRLSINKKKEYLDDTIEVYNIKNDRIIIDQTNPHQGVNFASFSYNNNLIVMGGSIKMNKNGEKIYTDKSHIYNVESGYWYELKNMISAKEVKGVIIENMIYLFGGFNGSPLTEIETYNITTGDWDNEGELFSGIKNPALAYSDNIIYILGNSKILTYNIITKTLNEYDINLKLEASRMHYYENKLYIIGGYTENEYSRTPSSNLFRIDIDEFETTEVVKSKSFSQKLISN